MSTMVKSGIRLLVILTCCCFQCVHCGTINDTKVLLTELLDNYNTNVRPIDNQSDTVIVGMRGFIRSINRFDEVSGELAFVGAFSLSWQDANMIWNPADYGEIKGISVAYSDVWVPDFVLVTPANKLETVGKKWNAIQYNSNGEASWMPVDLIESTCAVDVKYFPFDVQTCVTSFGTAKYPVSEVKVFAIQEAISTVNIEDNAVWNLNEAKLDNNTNGIDVIIVLARKPTFIIINVILPIMFLGLLNAFVFLLVPDSGERMSFAITVLLSIAVYMTIVNDLLPQTSAPVPIISYKLLIDMVLSSLIVLITIGNLKLYHMDDSVPIPARLKSVYHLLKCSCKKTSSIGPQEQEAIKVATEEQITEKGNGTSDKEIGLRWEQQMEDKKGLRLEESDDVDYVTWKDISKLFDKIAFITFTFLTLGIATLFLAITTNTSAP